MNAVNRYLKSLAIIFLAVGQIAAAPQPVVRNTGDVIADVTTPESQGLLGNVRGIAKAIGFDGQYLYYAEYAGFVLHRINVPPPGASFAAGHIDIPVLGIRTGIMAISYDAGRDAFWTIAGDGLSIYLLTKSGQARLMYIIDPLNDRPGNCKQRGALWMEGCSNEAKINYDGTDDTIWYAPDTSTRIYHYKTAPDFFGTAQLVETTPWVDVDIPPNDMYAECGYSQVSGLATGGPDLFVTIAGCPRYFEFTKTGLKVASYPEEPPSSGDFECDNLSYSVSVIWAMDGWNGHIRAYEQPAPNACRYGGALPQ